MQIEEAALEEIQTQEASLEEIQAQEAGLEEIQALLGEEYPVVVRYSEEKGRYVVAAREVGAGEVVMKAAPFSSSVEDHLKTHVCAECFAFSPENKYLFHCKRCCEVWYCSSECMEKASNEHALFECTYYRRIRVLGDNLELDSDGYTELKIVIRILTKMVYLKKKEEENIEEDLEDNPNNNSNNQNSAIGENNSDQGNNNDITNSTDSSNPDDNASKEQHKQREESYRDIFHLVSNHEAVNEIARSFIKDLQGLISKIMMKHIQSAFPAVEPHDIADIICRQRCNRFGIWSRKDKCLGIALSPAASFFNHSCVPNCVHEQEGKDVIIRTVHAVPKGGELCISYISLQQDTPLREAELHMNYHFQCSCIRCTDNTGVYDKWMENFFLREQQLSDSPFSFKD